MTASRSTLDFIKRWEGFSGTAYWDVSRWSIGYGGPSYEHEKIDIREAETRLLYLLDKIDDTLNDKLTFIPTSDQRTALTSAMYNLGVNGLNPVISLCNDGDYVGAADLLRTYCHAGGAVHPALQKRRAAEAKLLLSVMEVAAMSVGAPRVQYKRVYHLLNQNASIYDFIAVAREAYEDRGTVGFSYDDAGIGDLEERVVVLHGKHPGRIEEWFKDNYPGVVVSGCHKCVPVAPEPSGGVTGHALVGLHGSTDSSWGNPLLPECHPKKLK